MGFLLNKIVWKAEQWLLMPVIIAIQEADIRRNRIHNYPRQIVHKTLSWKK
jgi:hypothetical protein